MITYRFSIVTPSDDDIIAFVTFFALSTFDDVAERQIRYAEAKEYDVKSDPMLF